MPTEDKGEPTIAEAPAPLLVSVSPHIRSPESIPRIMWTVNAALAPAVAWGVYVFGLRALWLLLLGVGSAVATEAVLQALRKRPVTVGDGSAFLTGLLVVLVLPVHVPWYVVVTASVFGIGVAKQAFGGLGCNIWNPALAGRAFVVAAWAALTTVGAGWPTPFHYRPAKAEAKAEAPAVDAVTAATPLTKIKEGIRTHNAEVAEQLRKLKGKAPAEPAFPSSRAEAGAALARIREERTTLTRKLFLGLTGGCVGEVSALALLLGGAVLVALGYVKWQVPAFFIGTVALLSWVLPVPVAGGAVAYSAGEGAYQVKEATYLLWFHGEPVFEIFAGGLFLGAFFMATDMVTSPVTRRGLVVFAIGCGLLTAVIRRFGGYPEGVCYAILLMNTAVPLIDRYTRPRVFGRRATS